MPLTEFLLARIAEDERQARAATDGPWAFHVGSDLHEDSAGWVGSPGPTTSGGVFVAEVSNTADGLDDGGHIARHDPARVLAECEAKRRIVELWRAADSAEEAYGGEGDGWPEIDRLRSVEFALADVLRVLALPYADHPDFRAEWKP